MVHIDAAADRLDDPLKFGNGQEVFATVGVAVLMTLLAVPASAVVGFAGQGADRFGLPAGILCVIALLWYCVTRVTRSLEVDRGQLVCRRLCGTRRYPLHDVVSVRVGRETSSIGLLGLTGGLLADMFVRHKRLTINTDHT